MSIRSQLDAPNPFQTLSDIFSRLCSLFRTHSPAEPWKASTKPKPIPEIKAYYEAHMLKWLEAVADATKPQKPPGAAVVREAVVREAVDGVKKLLSISAGDIPNPQNLDAVFRGIEFKLLNLADHYERTERMKPPATKAPEPERARQPTLVETPSQTEQGTGAASMPPPPRADASDDPTAYISASKLIDDRFPDLKAIRKALDKNPEIRTKRPKTKDGREHPQRLEVHAGDWYAFKNRLPADPLDQPASVVDAALEVERQREAIDKEKGRK